MTTYDYDYLVLGAGSGGVRSARIAAGHGARVGMAEEYRVGGTCVIRGCVPKKMLVYGAHFAEDLKDGRRFGWDIGEPTFSWPTLRDNVLGEVDRINAAYETTLATHGVTVHRARATFVDANTLDVGGERITARHVLIAVGARPALPKLPGIELAITSNEVFHLPAVPARMAIIGTGYIANEFAGIFHELGAKVTLVARGDTILRGWDHSLRERLLATSMGHGIGFRFNADLTAIEGEADGPKRLVFRDGDPVETDCVLVAVGRVPNTQALGCEAAGVTLAADGAVVVGDTLETTAPGVYAVGDVINRVQLTPVAIREGHHVADALFGGQPAALDYACIPSSVFSHPPLASVGLTESDARQRYGNIRVYSSDFRPMKYAFAGRSERALYKLVVDAASDRVLGAHMIGPEAPEILQALAIAVKAGLTKAALDATVAIHPTMAEELVLMR